MIDRWKNKAWFARTMCHNDEKHGYVRHEFTRFLSGLYQDRMKELNAVDFGDLLLHMVDIMEERILKFCKNSKKAI